MSKRSARFRYFGKRSDHELDQKLKQSSPERLEPASEQQSKEQKFRRISAQRFDRRIDQGRSNRRTAEAQAGNRRAQESPPASSGSVQLRRRWAFVCCEAQSLKDPDNILVFLTLSSMLLAIPAGLIIRSMKLSDLTVMLIGYPGELFVRMLKMLTLPLVVSSLVAGSSSLNIESSGRIGVFTMVYCLLTTWAAAMLGIVLAISVRPGHSNIKNQIKVEDLNIKQSNKTVDNLLDLLRNAFPSNILKAAFLSTQTQLVPGKEPVGGLNHTNATDSVTTETIYIPETNVLGLLTSSIIFGLVLKRMEGKARIMKEIFIILTDAVIRMVKVVIWYSPIGIFSITVKKIIVVEDVQATFRSMGPFIITVLVGFVIHICFVQALTFLVMTRTNPFIIVKGIFQALVTALGTASSTATLPITFRCLDENNGIDKRLIRFVLPVGVTVNMNATALYTAVSTFFVAQINEASIDPGGIVALSLMTTLVSASSAGLPGGAVPCMMIVARTVGLPADDVSLINKVDWLLDPPCTLGNIIGDAFCAGILDHISRNRSLEFLPNTPRPLQPVEPAPTRDSYLPVNNWLKASIPREESSDGSFDEKQL